MGKYSLTITTNDVDMIQKIADLAAIVTYDREEGRYDYPIFSRIIPNLDWLLEQLLLVTEESCSKDEVEEIIAFLERKPDALRTRLAEAKKLAGV